jgi:hypothetical protein
VSYEERPKQKMGFRDFKISPPKADGPTTLVALPFVSKQGFMGATTMALILGILGGGFRNCKFLFLGDHSQVSARNAAVDDALKEGLDYLFFIDSDMDFPVDTLKRLMAVDADIACTDMWSRNIPSFRTVMRMAPKDDTGMARAVPYEGHGVEEIDICGMACTLIKTSLLRNLKEKIGPEQCFTAGRHGEDASFCFIAKEIGGATIKCDFGITSGHWGVARMAGQDWSRDAKNQPMAVANVEMMQRMGAVNLPKE